MTVMDTIRDLPDLVIIFLVSAIALALVALTGLVARQLRHDSPRSPAALEAYKIIVTYTAILLSFTLLQAQNTLRLTEGAVSREAGSMNQIDRVLLRYRTAGTDRIRPLLHDYMRSVLNDEWPAMRRGGGSPTTAARLATLNRAVQTLDSDGPVKPQLYAEMLKHLDGLNDSRQERVDGSSAGVPPVLWLATTSLCVVLLFLSALIRVPGRLVAIGGHAIAIALLWALAFIVDEPYRGETAVSPAPIERVLATALSRAD